MEIIQESENIFNNLKIQHKEFCAMWGCVCLEREYPCTICPVISDLSKMARDLRIVVPEWDKEVTKAA